MCTQRATSQYFSCCYSRQEGQQAVGISANLQYKNQLKAKYQAQGQRGLGSCGIVCGRCHGNISWW